MNLFLKGLILCVDSGRARRGVSGALNSDLYRMDPKSAIAGLKTSLESRPSGATVRSRRVVRTGSYDGSACKPRQGREEAAVSRSGLVIGKPGLSLSPYCSWMSLTKEVARPAL